MCNKGQIVFVAKLTHCLRRTRRIALAKMSQEDALMRVIRIQKQMIDDFANVSGRLDLVINVLAGLDEHFRRIFFTRILSCEFDDMPRSIPTKQELEDALLALGFTPTMPSDLNWWNSLHRGRNPWEAASVQRVGRPSAEI